MRPWILMSVLLVALASTAQAAPKPRLMGEARLAKILEGRTAGPPLDCVDLRSVETVEIIDRTAILYRMPGGRLYVSRPEAGAADLKWDSTLTSRTVGARLCRYDTMIASRFGGASFLLLGPFAPYGKVAP
ncbi:hypothetical protein [Caulobacter sp. UC70_42]|uniref:hypothetical protein n=1 Tax=Caulobacter sp. UC70_42 TaxID=3374551 RepID=UPI0037583B2B